MSLFLMLAASGCAQLNGSNEQVKAIVKAAQEAEDKRQYEEAQAKLAKLKQLPLQLAGSTDDKRIILNDIIKRYTALARHYQESGDFVTAKRLLLRAIEIECMDKQWLRDGGLATESWRRLMKSQSTDKQLMVEKRVGDVGKTSEEVVRLIASAQKLERGGQYQPALDLLKQTEKLCAPNSGQRAEVLIAMAGPLNALKRTKDTILVLKEALQIYDVKPPQFPLLMVSALMQLALALEVNGRYDEAGDAYARALDFTDKHPGSFPDEVYLLGRRAHNLIMRRKFDQGEPLAARFQSVAKVGKNIDLGNAVMYNVEVGDVYLGNKMLPKAKQSYKRAVKLLQSHSYPAAMNPSAGYAYMQLANSEVALGELDESAAHANAAADLVGRDWKLGVAGTFNNLAGAYKDKGKVEKALVLNERALKLCEASVGRYGLETLSTLIQYSDTAFIAGDQAKSRWCLVEGFNRSKHMANCDEKGRLIAVVKERMKVRNFKF